MSSSYRQELNKWLEGVRVDTDTVFDVGGAQEPIKNKVASWNVDNYLIFDLPEPHADSPKPDVEIDLNIPNKVLNDYRGLADIVFCLEVFDYIYDPVTAMRNIESLMKKGGLAYISYPFYYPIHNPIEDDCLRYTEFGIKKLADRVGLEITNVTYRRPETNAIDNVWRMERMRAAKHFDHNVTGYIVEFSK